MTFSTTQILKMALPTDVERHQAALSEYVLLTRFLRAGSLQGLMDAARSGLNFTNWGYDDDGSQRRPIELAAIDSFLSASGWEKFLQQDSVGKLLEFGGLTGNSSWMTPPIFYNGSHYHLMAGDASSVHTAKFFKMTHPNILAPLAIGRNGRSHALARLTEPLISLREFYQESKQDPANTELLRKVLLPQLVDVTQFVHGNGWIMGYAQAQQIWVAPAAKMLYVFPSIATVKGHAGDTVGGLSQASDWEWLKSLGLAPADNYQPPAGASYGSEYTLTDPLPAGEVKGNFPAAPVAAHAGAWIDELKRALVTDYEAKAGYPTFFRTLDQLMQAQAAGTLPQDVVRGEGITDAIGRLGFIARTPLSNFISPAAAKAYVDRLPAEIGQYEAYYRWAIAPKADEAQLKQWIAALVSADGTTSFDQLNQLFTHIDMLMSLAARGLITGRPGGVSELEALFLQNINIFGSVRSPLTYYLEEKDARKYLEELPQLVMSYQARYNEQRSFRRRQPQVLSVPPLQGAALTPYSWRPLMRSADLQLRVDGAHAWDLARWSTADAAGPFLLTVTKESAKRFVRNFLAQPAPVKETKATAPGGETKDQPASLALTLSAPKTEVKQQPLVFPLGTEEAVIIFGVRFDAHDLNWVFHGTPLATATSASNFDYLTPDDVGLLHEFLSGRIMPFVLYGGLSSGAFKALMQPGSYLHYYELLPLRHLLDSIHVRGRPVREQFVAQKKLLLEQNARYGIPRAEGDMQSPRGGLKGYYDLVNVITEGATPSGASLPSVARSLALM